MRFLIASHLPGEHAVVRRDTDFMFETARTLIDAGHEATMLFSGPATPKEREVIERIGIPYYEHPSTLRSPRAVPRLVQEIRRRGIDCTLTQWHATYPLAVAASISRVPRRFYRVNSFPWAFGPPTFASRMRNRVLHSTLSTGFVTCSDALSRNVAELFDLPLDHVHTAYPGIRRSEHAIDGHGGGHGPSGNGDGPSIVTTAVLRAHKGHTDLLSAARAVVDRHPAATFHCNGGGPLQESLEAQAQALGLGQRVCFHGSTPVDEVFESNRTATLAVLPSHSEGFGYVLLEAMAWGKPVVATRVGGIPEVVADGETGFLVEVGQPEALADRINEILDDPALARTLGAAALARVKERFDIRKQAEHLAEILLEG